jgi:SAM-dependent methyltransferase
MFHEQSYELHSEWYNQHFPTASSKSDFYKQHKQAEDKALSNWLQQLFFDCLLPLLKSKSSWLTIGDAYGLDAQYILSKGSNALATDLNTAFLTVAQQEGIVEDYAAENAEKLSFADKQFDYVLCKESYHHFPRPYAALYEMMRVAERGIVVIEPQDPVSKMPLLLALTNLFSSYNKVLNKIWKNRFSYEPVGNFIYKVSEREFEKFAAGLNLPMVAFKQINPNFYFKGADNISIESKQGKVIRLKKWLLDQLVRFKIIPGQVLSTIIFKQQPDKNLQDQLKKSGYRLVLIPENPYIN